MEPEHGNAWSPDRNSYIGVASHEDADWIELLLDGKDFQLLNREPVKLRAMLGVTVYEEQARLQPRQGAGWSKIPGFGSVALVDDYGSTMLWWRSPLHSPSGRFLCSIRDPASEMYQAEWAAMYPGVSDYLHISPVILLRRWFPAEEARTIGARVANSEGCGR